MGAGRSPCDRFLIIFTTLFSLQKMCSWYRKKTSAGCHSLIISASCITKIFGLLWILSPPNAMSWRLFGLKIRCPLLLLRTKLRYQWQGNESTNLLELDPSVSSMLISGRGPSSIHYCEPKFWRTVQINQIWWLARNFRHNYSNKGGSTRLTNDKMITRSERLVKYTTHARQGYMKTLWCKPACW